MEKLTREQVLSLSPISLNFISPSSEDILGWFEALDAGWIYQGEPSPAKPHAELASGLCSNGYFNCRKVMCYPRLAEILAIQLYRKLRDKITPDVVVGSAYSAITFSYEVARTFGVPHFFVEKDPSDFQGKKMIWKEEIPAFSRVLQAEELITTLGTTQEVCRAINEKNSYRIAFIEVVGVCVHRPNNLLAGTERKIVALVEKQVSTWQPGPETCPYCRVGSPRVKPKANWAKLTGKE